MVKTFLEVALQATKKAENIIQHYATEEIRATLKPDQSPVTIADKEAENSIIQTIKTHFPEHSFLGEESGEKINQSEYLWIIDPIDGTKNYLRKIPLYATQIALLHRGKVILGISNAPALKECITAEKEKGAYFNGTRVNVSYTKTLKEAYMSFGGITYFQNYNQLDKLVSLANATQGKRGIGDAWSYHLLATGKIDIMVEASIKIWDIAAISLIIEEAGGKVSDIAGNPITNGTTSFVATNGILHDKILSYFR